jgi:hypothetical protein
MTSDDPFRLSAEQIERLRRCYQDLKELARCQIPSVRAAARVAVAELHAALSGQGLDYEHYSSEWSEPNAD